MKEATKAMVVQVAAVAELIPQALLASAMVLLVVKEVAHH